MKYCNECGAELNDSAEFCDECGAKQDVETESQMAQQIPEQMVDTSPAKEEKKEGGKGKKIVLIVILFLAAAAVVAVIWVFVNQNEKKNANNTADADAATKGAAEAVTEESAPGPAKEPTPEPTEESTPEATKEPTPVPTPEPTPQPTPTPYVDYSYVQDSWCNDDSNEEIWQVEIVSVSNNVATFAISYDQYGDIFGGYMYAPKPYRTGFLTSPIENGVMKFNCTDTTGLIQVNGEMVFSTSDMGVANLSINTFNIETEIVTTYTMKMINSHIYRYTN